MQDNNRYFLQSYAEKIANAVNRLQEKICIFCPLVIEKDHEFRQLVMEIKSGNLSVGR